MCALIYLKHILSCGCTQLHYLSEPHWVTMCICSHMKHLLLKVEWLECVCLEVQKLFVVVWCKECSETNRLGRICLFTQISAQIFWRFYLTFQRQTALNSSRSCWQHQKKETIQLWIVLFQGYDQSTKYELNYFARVNF